MFQKITASLVFIGISGIALASSAGAQGASLFSMDMLFRGLNFVILLFLLYKFARKPIAKMLTSSAENSKNALDTANSELVDAKKQLAEYKEKIANLEKELEDKKQSAMAAIEEEKKQIVEDAERQTKKLEEQSQNRIEQEILKAKAEIREFLAIESVKLAEKAISEQINTKNHKKLIDDYTEFLKKTA